MKKYLLIILIFLSCAKDQNSDLISNYQFQITQLNSQISQLNSQLSQSQSRILELQSTINSLNNQVASIDNLEETISNLNTEITILEQNISQLESENSQIPQLENTISTLNTDISYLQSFIDDLTSGIEGLENLDDQISALNNQVQSIPALGETINSLNTQIIDLESTISFLNAETSIPQLEDTIEELVEIIYNLNSGFRTDPDPSNDNWLEEKLISLASQIEYLELQIDGLNVELLQFQSLSDGTLQNETTVNVLLDLVYASLDGVRGNDTGADWHIAGNNWWSDAISDDAHKGSTDGDQADLYAIEIFSWEATNPYFLHKWNSHIKSVNRANSVIDHINKSENPSLYITQLAQARFLRAHFNFELQKMWKNVPFISADNFAAGELNQPNTGPIWDKIEDDFIYAINNLPVSRGDDYNDPGRPIVTTAQAYLGKTFLFQDKWVSALNNFDAVINSGLYSLHSDYFANFRSDGENGPEMIFSIQFTAGGGLSPRGNRGGTANYPVGPMTGGMCCGFYQPTIDLGNAFQTDSNGLPLSNWSTQDIVNDYGIETEEPFTPHTGPLDPRIDYTIGRRGIEFNGYGLFTGKENIRASFSDISGPYASKKNMYTADDYTNRGTGGWGEQRSGINYHIIRYADVLLMAAEAAVEIGNLEKARLYVNEVRERAKNSPRADSSPNYVIDTYNSTWSDVSAARTAVRHERRVELAMEGHRLFDLRRWQNMASTMTTYIVNESRTIQNFGAKVNPAQDKHNAFPIPLDAIESSDGVLNQNTGH